MRVQLVRGVALASCPRHASCVAQLGIPPATGDWHEPARGEGAARHGGAKRSTEKAER